MSDPKKEVTKLPFEPKTNEFMAIRTLDPAHALHELNSIPLSLVTPYISTLATKAEDRFFRHDPVLAEKLTKMRYLPVSELAPHFKAVIDSDDYNEVFDFASQFHDRQRFEILLNYQRLHPKKTVNKQIYRHTTSSAKFVDELFATPDLNMAREQFAAVPLNRREEWLEAIVRTSTVSVCEPEALRLKRCLSGTHQPKNAYAMARPCERLSQHYTAAIKTGRQSRDYGKPCFFPFKTLQKFMMDRPDFDLAKAATEKFVSCVRANRVVNYQRANILFDLQQEQLKERVF